MPELPEIETIKQGLEEICGKRISNYYRSNFKLRITNSQDYQKIITTQITAVRRRARYLIIDLSNDLSLIIHLGMSGRLTLQKEKQNLKHDHFTLDLEDNFCLIFNDPRRFGFVDLVKTSDLEIYKTFAKLGCEPLSAEFNAKYLQAKLKGKKINIKTAMMNNEIVVGVGNIYINESLFLAKISPLKEAGKLNIEEIKKLVTVIKKVLKKAIDLGGSSINDYVNSKGDVGSFQSSFKVYSRHDQKCLLCKEIITKIVQNGRSSFYCPQCQK
jgi:formamidopyrimidine-DNA glycosylase